MTDLTPEALDALQERLRRIEWGVTGEPCAAGNVDETAALEADTAITALRARLSLYEGSTGPVSVSGIVQDMEGTITALRAQLVTPSAPSPEAVARAALEWALEETILWTNEDESLAAILTAAHDPATLAAIIAKAGGGE